MRRFRDIIEDIKGQDAPTVKWDDIDDKPEDAAAICAKVNALLSALRASGALQS